MGKPSLSLKSLILHSGRTGEEPLYKETKREEDGRAADEVKVLMMKMEYNIFGGKGLC